MAPEFVRGGTASTSRCAPQPAPARRGGDAHRPQGQLRCREASALGCTRHGVAHRPQRRGQCAEVSCSAIAVVAERLSSSYVLPSLLHPGGTVFNALGALSVSSLVAGSVSLSKSLWDRYGRRSVFGDDADDAAQTVQLFGVDTSGYAILSDPTVVRAAEFAAAAHAGQVRRTGEAYVTHAVETARIMAGLVPSSSPRSVSAVVAALLHDVVDDTSTTLDDVAAAFGAEVASLVDGVTRLSQLNQLLRRHRRLEMVEGAWATPGPTVTDALPGTVSGGLAPSDGATLRALILSMVDDPRVVLLKLADRLHNMRTLHALAPDKARAVAGETLGVWCSLAARLGVWAMKAELEDLCFAVLMPSKFLCLKTSLDGIWGSRDAAALQAERSDAEMLAQLVADYPPRPGDELLTEEQKRTRALLACVLPFDFLTPRQWDARTRVLPDGSGAPASAAAALEALMACQKALRDELRLSAVAPGLEVMVQGRLKSLWSTHMKMQRKACGAAEVYDARALRVVVEDTSTRNLNVETEACYSLLSAVHKLWKPVGGEYDNYIANPKRSGYQSLHTAVRAPDGAPLEVQVRTRAMHEEAEYGAAAHWLYKDAAAPTANAAAPSLMPPGGAGAPGLIAAAAAVVEPLVKALATADGGPAARAAAEFTVAAAMRAGVPAAPELGASTSAPTLPAVPPGAAAVAVTDRRRVPVGAPLLRVAEGRLNDAVVVGAEEGRLLVAVQFGERWGATAGRRASAAEYEALANLVASRGWFSPGQGDFRVCLEEYALCSDGRYHKIDAYGRKLDACVELLDLSAGVNMPSTPQPREVQGGSPPELPLGAARRQTEKDRTEEDALNDKVRLLRSLLTWEQDMRGGGGGGGDVRGGAGGNLTDAAANTPATEPRLLESSEVMCVVWPQGKALRLPVGATAGEVAVKFMYATAMVNVNNVLVPASTPLQDGDIVIISPLDSNGDS